MKKLLVLSIFLVGCNQGMKPQTDPRSISGINPAFTLYVQQFEAIWGKSIGDIPIQFGKQEGNVIGVCTVWNAQWRQIEIDPDYWANGAYDDEERMSLIFHELGHCALNRGHLSTTWTYTNTWGPWSVPVSFMNPYIFYSLYPPYPDLKAYYINELFHPAPGSPTLYNSADEVVRHTDTRADLKHN